MRPYETRRETRRLLSHIRQLLFRIVLLTVVCLMALKIRPRIQSIPQDKLLCEYKQPRVYSYFPIWAMVLLVVFAPLLLFWLLSENIKETAEVILTWSLSISVTAMVTEVLKLVVGRPRPDFFYRCFPDGIMILRANEPRCSGNLRDVMEGRKSFPSGHASLSFASLGMLSLYLHGRWRILDGSNRVAQMTCYVLPVMIATVIGISRWLDNHHHWEDVLVGSLIGFSTSYVCYYSDYDACQDISDLGEASETSSSIKIGGS